ncbi:hypothetical protein BY996DRAFT_7526218 [Phakopsora pachyrhizi]|nr:hypothetical protein BY996DRAFT_7526218 [Phakopsora pachyrhizi]
MVKGSDIVLILVAVIFPPASAIFVTGCGCDLLINILLTILGYIPGHVHAFYLRNFERVNKKKWLVKNISVIYKRMQAEERYGREGYKYVGNATYEPIGYEPNMNPAPAPPAYGSTV